MQVDSTTYNKAAKYPQRHGYQLRGTQPTSVVCHSTEGPKGQPLASAASYLYHSAKVSAHFLVGKGGEIIQFLDPRTYQAWHAGTARAAYTNPRSIGIECLHAKGEAWGEAQKAALTWLVQDLMGAYSIPLSLIETHGQIAIPGPYDRKKDPTDWPHAAFLEWRATLAPVSPPPTTFKVRGVPVYQRADIAGPLAGYLFSGDVVEVDQVKNGVAHLKNGLGFFDADALEVTQ